MPLLLIFVALPLVEIALFIAIGSEIGVGLTLLLILGGALLGAAILRGQQARAVAMMQSGIRVAPGTFLAQGAFRVLAGVLLILPGFLTDALGLILLLPPLQRALVRAIGARATVHSAHVWQRDDIVEGVYTVREPGADSVADPARDPLGPDRRIDDQRH